MSNTKEFPTSVIASLSTGILLCTSFSQYHEAAEYLMGHPIWTHHFADLTLADEMKKTIAAQYPEMPIHLDNVERSENWVKRQVEELEQKFGKTLRIKKGCGLTAMLPTDGIPNHIKVLKI
jgi:hypothetical protein